MNLRRADVRPFVIGHRGAAAVAPENTLEALASAVAAGADLVEFDVGAGLRLGHSLWERPKQPVSLDEALGYLEGQQIGIYIDLKAAGLERRIVAAVRTHGLGERVVLSSTSASSLRRLARLAPELSRTIAYPRDRVGVSRIPWPQSLTSAGAAALRSVMPARAPLLIGAGRTNALALHHTLVSPGVVRTTHARGAALLAWTVNRPERVEELAELGVDVIVSDDPGMALEVLAKLNQL